LLRIAQTASTGRNPAQEYAQESTQDTKALYQEALTLYEKAVRNQAEIDAQQVQKMKLD
jgi:hypothetical protein